LLAVAVLAWPGEAGSAPRRVVVLGETARTLRPDCPARAARNCQAVGRVTGFQSLAGGTQPRPFAAPFDGKVVSWSISLSRPSAKDTETTDNEIGFFNELFSKPSIARIGILKRVPRTKPPEYRLVRQSPRQVLNPYFGSTPEFALEHPLSVAEGQIVALTIPTWAPAFLHSGACEPLPGTTTARDPDRCTTFSERNTWRGSRRKGRCLFNATDPDELQAQVNHSYPQQKINSRKEYGCYYEGARLLYTATLVKKPAGR
jgi:hypothetical protein